MAMHVVGLFDDASAGQAVVRDLETAGFDSGNIELNSSNANVLVSRLTSVGVPENDANVYAEAVRRGGSVVIVHTQTDDQAQQAADIMNRHNIVDIENRGREYRSAGWTRFDEDVDDSTATTTDRDTAYADRDTTYVDRDTSYAETTGVRADTDLRGTTQPTDEAVIPVVEEELRVGTREVDRGGVRVNVDVEETPVEEQVTLREERVRVERRPVDRPISDADAALQEGTFEVWERGEEAVVDKQARVVEEVVVDKDVEERTETIQETVRRTDVDVEETSDQTRGAGLTDRIEGATGVDIDRDDDVAGRPPRR